MWHIRMNDLFFFFNDTATTEIYTLSLHDALPISRREGRRDIARAVARGRGPTRGVARSQLLAAHHARSEEHTSELQSRSDLVCRLLLEKKKKTPIRTTHLGALLVTFSTRQLAAYS